MKRVQRFIAVYKRVRCFIALYKRVRCFIALYKRVRCFIALYKLLDALLLYASSSVLYASGQVHSDGAAFADLFSPVELLT